MLSKSLTEKALAFLLGLFLFAILLLGGNTRQIVIALAVLAVCALLLGASVAWRSRESLSISSATGLALTGMLCIVVSAVLALIPFRPELWLSLPGRASYGNVVGALLEQPFNLASIPLSLDPVGSGFAALSLVIALGVGLPALSLAPKLILRVLGVLAFLAITEAALGIALLATGISSVWGYSANTGAVAATGTFVNKNHFATLLAMSLPLLIFRAAGQFAFFRYPAPPSPLSNVWWGAGATLVATALIASLSRAGCAAGFSMATLAVALCVFRRQATSPQRLALLGVGALTLALASGSSLKLLLDSLQGSGFAENVEGRRWLVRLSLDGLKAFFPLGSGLGSYSIAFQRFQSPDVAGYVEHVHNDYVELIFETGVLGAAALICLAASGVAAAARLWKTMSVRSQPLSPAIACWLGAAAFAVHAWFDFPAHIPGLIIVVSLLFAAAMNERLLRAYDGSSRHAEG